MKVRINDELINKDLKIKLRLDFKGEIQQKVFFKNKNIIKAAEEIRDLRVASLQNVPLQGIMIKNIDLGLETYVIYDEFTGEESAFAPVVIDLEANDIEDLLKFVMKEEFRKVEIIEPEEIVISNKDLERFLFKTNEESKMIRQFLEKKYYNK